MALTDFLHGVEVVSLVDAVRTVRVASSSVIGLVGTAADADVAAFPLDTPVAIYSRGGYAKIGTSGTLKRALDGIFDQTTTSSAIVVVIRVTEGVSPAETLANVIGGVNATTGVRKGIYALRDAKTGTGVQPMLLIAPGFTSARTANGVTATTITAQGSGYTSAPTVTFSGGGANAAKVLPTATAVLGTGANAAKVVSITMLTRGSNLDAAPTIALTGGGGTGATATATTGTYANQAAEALRTVAGQLRAHAIVAGPNTTDADAIAYRGDFGDRRLYVVDPYVTRASDLVAEDAAARVAGLIARVDAEVGFHKSPSNEVINGIVGLARPIDYALGDTSSRANVLNANEVATIIRDDGFRLWGNRTSAPSNDTFAFLCVSRTADIIDLSIQAAHRYACDQVLGKGYFDSVVSSVNAFLRQLQSRGVILGGKCWVDPDLNTSADVTAGHPTFSYDFQPPAPAERLTFRSSIASTYTVNLFTTTGQ